MDRRYLGKGMSMGERQRTKLEEDLVTNDPGESLRLTKSVSTCRSLILILLLDHPLVARPVSKKITWTALIELTCMVIVAWTLFIYYVL